MTAPTIVPPAPAATIDSQIADSQIAIDPKIELDPPAPAKAAAAPVVVPVVSHVASRTPVMHHASRKAPVTPRRVNLPLDPDGTIEPSE